MKLHASCEDYLEAVLMLQKTKGMVRSGMEKVRRKIGDKYIKTVINSGYKFGV